MTPIAAPEPAPPSSLLTRTAVGISIAVHLAAVAWSLGYAGAGLYASAPEAVPVSLVSPEEVTAPAAETAPASEPQTDPGKLDLRLAPLDSAPPTPPPSPSQAQPAAPASAAKPKQAAAPPPAAQPAYTQPSPDISLRYQVDLGLKQIAAALPQPAPPSAGQSDFDAPAMNKADIDTSRIAAFRAKLKQCAVLPSQIGADDRIVIVLRATFTPEARLAATPILIEASASAKGPALMQAAIAALQTCQPHTTLPAESYAEWRVLDMRFTPQDFRKG